MEKGLMTMLSSEQITSVKARGFLRNRGTDCFSGRVVTVAGMFTPSELRALADCAEKYGNGKVIFTSRLAAEVVGIPFDKIPEAEDFLAERGLRFGGTGAKVRPVTACKGTTCVFGLIDTFALSEKMHERFYKAYHGTVLPHKFKMAVGGCPNNCVKPDLNDIGVIGQRIPNVNSDICRACKKCAVEAACPMGAASVSGNTVTVNAELCNNCGRCIPKCPFGAITSEGEAYRVYIGGRWGKKTAQAVPLGKIFTNQDEVLDVIERAIILFRDEGISGERFSDTIARLGFEYVESKLIGG